MKRNYNTKQRQTVLDFVKKTKGTHFSVDDIYVRIKEAGLSMGKATVYRHINDLEEDAVIKKYSSEFGKSACFEYIEEAGKPIYHFKCATCQNLIHVNCLSLDDVKTHLLEEHGFAIDSSKLFFVGECRDCRENKNK